MAKAGEIVAKLRLDIADYQKNIDKSKKEMEEFSGVATKVSKGVVVAMAAIVTAMTGVAIAGGKMAVEQEKALSKVQAQTAMTDEQMQEFKKTADDLFVGGRGSYEEIYATLGNIKQVLGESGDVAGETAEGVLLLNEIFGYETPESIRAIESANKAWGSSSKDTLDLITALSQQAGDKADDLLDTFWEYAPVMAEAGFSAEEFGNILNEGMENGAFNFDKIGDALKEFNVRLTDGSTQANGMAEELFGSAKASEEFFKGISSGKITSADALGTITDLLGKIEDPIKRNTLGVAFFGTMWEDLGAEAMLAMGNADDSLMEVEGSLERAGDALDDNIGTKIAGIGISIAFWTKQIGEKLLPGITEVVDGIIEILPRILDAIGPVIVGFGNMVLGMIDGLISITKFIMDNKEAFAVLAGVIGGLLIPMMVGYASVAIPLALKAVAAQVGAFLGLAKTYMTTGMALMGLNATMMTVFGVIGLLVAVGLLLWKNWDAITAKLAEFGITSENATKLLNKLKDGMSALWEAFKGSAFVQGFISMLEAMGINTDKLFASMNNLRIGGIEALKNAWDSLKEGFGSFGATVTTLSGFFANLGENISALWESFKGSSVFGIVGGYVQGLIDKFVDLYEGIKAVINSGDFTPLVNAVVALLPTIIGLFMGGIPKLLFIGANLFRAVAEGMGLTVPELIEKVTNMIVGIIEQFAIMLPALVETGAQLLISLIEGIVSQIPMILNVVTSIINAYVGFLTTAYPIIIQAGITLLMTLIEGILSALPMIIDVVLTLITTLLDTFISLLPMILDVGIQILMAIVNGLITALPFLIEAVISLLTSIVEIIISLLPIILDAGIQILMALINGIISMLPAILDAILSIIMALVDVVISLLPVIIEVGIKLLLALINGIIKVLPQLLSAGMSLIMALVNTFITLLPVILNAGIKILLALIKGIVQIIPQLLSTALNLVMQIARTLISNAPQILSAGVKLILALIRGVLSMIGSVGSAIMDIGSAIKDKLSGISLVSIGKDLIRGLWNGISDMSGWIGRKIKGFGDGVVSGLKSFFGIHSPSRLFRDEIGVMLVRGLNVGIEKMKNLPIDTMTGIADDVVGTFDNLGNIDVAPQISGLANAHVDVSKHVDVGDGNGGGTNYNAPIVQVENMHVRDESDVRSVSRELFNLQRTKDRSKGGK